MAARRMVSISRSDWFATFAGMLAFAPRKNLGCETVVKLLRAKQSVAMSRKVDAIGIAMFVLLVALLAFRITRGVDLSDESYYAIFVDDWLKGSIATSAFRTIHQTAALIVYPATLLYATLTGSSDGLFLLLRAVFLTSAVISALFWLAFLKRLGHGLLAWAGGIFVLAFVPFGLPAPSYNTLGQQALTIALASFGCAALADPNREQVRWLAVSACAWSVATIAYPSLVAPLAMLCLSGLLYRDGSFPRAALYLALTGAAVCVGWAVVAFSLTPTRLIECFTYSSGTYVADGWRRKMAFIHDTFAANPAFSALSLAAVIVGVVRQVSPLLIRLAVVGLIAGVFAITPVLYVRSHDAVTLVALTGLGLLAGLRPNASRSERVIGLVYATSLFAALATSATAYYSIFNFSIGALPAAALAIVGRPGPKPLTIAGAASTAVGIAAVLSTSLFFYYGEIPGQPVSPRERMAGGFFSGLALIPNDAAIVRLVQNDVNPLLGNDQSAAVIGRLPGLALAMPARLSMPMAYAISASPGSQQADKKWLAMTQAFYEQPGRQPSLVLIYSDAYFAPTTPILQFSDRYAPAAELKTPLGSLLVFRRR